MWPAMRCNLAEFHVQGQETMPLTTPEAQLTIRSMARDDLPDVLRIQRESFDDTAQESLQSFQAKLIASPSTCFVAIQQGQVVGYLVAILASSDEPPALHGEVARIPAAPDCLYLHDLSVSQIARGSGVARALMDGFMTSLRQQRLPRACLTAVNGSQAYWTRYGFRVVAPVGAAVARLATYGSDAQYMMLVVPDA